MAQPSTSQSRKIPDEPGSYALLLRLPKPQTLSIGSLGETDFPAGTYVYLGNAFGPGGLRARLARHLRGGPRPHWHIDYFRSQARLFAYCYAMDKFPSKQKTSPLTLECHWSQALASTPGATIVAFGFGSSDCTACPAHLIAFPAGIELNNLHTVLAKATPMLTCVKCSPL